MSTQLTALCAVTSFLWIAHNLEDHLVIEHPRLSSLLVFIIASASCYIASFGSSWLPGNNGRFDDELLPSKPKRLNLPQKPRRFFFPGLVIAILLRLELFHRVSFDLQCSTQGIEAFLPLLVLLYELLPGRRTRPGSAPDADDHDDMGMTIVDALGSWFTESRTSLTLSVVLLSLGTYMAVSQDQRSTFFCASSDPRALIIFFQWTGLLLDTLIIIALWRILVWCRTTKHRLKTLSGLLLAVALGSTIFYWASRMHIPAAQESYSFHGLDSLYAFDVTVDALAVSAFLISTCLLATEGSPLTLVATIAFLFGVTHAVQSTILTGTWENVSAIKVYFALTFISVGFSLFVYANNVVKVVCVHRAFIVFLLVVATLVATIYTPVKALKVVNEHPISRLIYDARTAASRWQLNAAMSNSLKVAVNEYRERNNGRAPPPKFDVWYEFAREKKSPIIDHFPQIENDLLPFWGVSPSQLREGIRRAAEEPSIALLQIQGGKAKHNLPPSSPDLPIINDLVALIQDFAQHLPDMELAINLDERPRVLAPADVVQRAVNQANRRRVGKLLPRAASAEAEASINSDSETTQNGPNAGGSKRETAIDEGDKGPDGFTSVVALREMTALTCPTGTKARAGTHWDIRDLCSSCAKPHSKGQYPADWTLTQDLCHQPDLYRLHSFYMTPSHLRPIQDLLPVFSRAKTDSYADILLPLRRITEPPPPPEEPFKVKEKKFFWRGKIDRTSTTYEQFRGGHQERLIHLLTKPARSERSRVQLIFRDDVAKKDRVDLYQVPTGRLNGFLPLDVGFSSYTSCRAGAGNCVDQATIDSSFRVVQPGEDMMQDALRSRYVLLLDTDHGPPRDLLRTLRSASVPFLASIFKEWYTDRLLPWVHFVPVDLRYHGLHGTLAYFTGMPEERGGIKLVSGGATTASGGWGMKGKEEDGKWIAEEGKRWAEKALRREDMQVYLFRLLLEWGRVASDGREEMGFAV
ncbi:hypothetical protein VTJ04DRAFT_1480 [Mycothermus thermophilus]|uniref:uncharacterized protein n=1 Tax=Humicola insolens TaxID=85995 RepID=UPI003742B4AF